MTHILTEDQSPHANTSALLSTSPYSPTPFPYNQLPRVRRHHIRNVGATSRSFLHPHSNCQEKPSHSPTHAMYPTKTKEPLPTTISMITTAHTQPRIYALFSGIIHPTLTTTKYKMDLLPQNATPSILPVLENDSLF